MKFVEWVSEIAVKCLYCQASLTEGSPICPHCGFALDKVEPHFGSLPAITPGISDPDRCLNWRERHRLGKAIRRFERRFPQLRFHLAVVDVAPEIPMAPYNFWLFNNSPLCSAIEKGGLNFHLLLLIDPSGCRANLMIGYGLEPFVSGADLDEIVGTSRELLNGGDFGEAALAVLASAMDRLTQISDAIPETYGLEPPSFEG